MAEYKLLLKNGLMGLGRSLDGTSLGTKSWYTRILYIYGPSALERLSK